MNLKGTKLYSIFTYTCPSCQEGKLFVEPNAYKLSGMTEMHKKCAVCGQNFQREPGFYYGAAYVSYALTVALWVAVFVALTTFSALGLFSFDIFDDAFLFMVVGTISLIVLLPILYRTSRAMWINFFVQYKGIPKPNDSKSLFPTNAEESIGPGEGV